MKAIAALKIAPEFDRILTQAAKENKHLHFKTSKGAEFVLLKKEELSGWKETRYLLSSKKNAQALRRAMKEPRSLARNWREVAAEIES